MATYSITQDHRAGIMQMVTLYLSRYMDYQANNCPLDWEDLQHQIIPDPSARAWCENGLKVAPDMVPQRKDFKFRVLANHQCERQLAFTVTSKNPWCVAHLYDGQWYEPDSWAPTSRNAITIRWFSIDENKRNAFADWVNNIVEIGRHNAFVIDLVEKVLAEVGDKTTSLYYHWEFLTQFITDATLKKRMQQLPQRVLARYKPSFEFEERYTARIRIAEPLILRGKLLPKWETPADVPLTFDYMKHKKLPADKF